MRVLKLAAAIGMASALSAGMIAHSHAAPAAAKKATIKGAEVNSKYVFSPANKTIKVGTKVTWKDASDAPHTVTSDTASWKFDKKFDASTKVSATFKKAGTYKYHCSYHPGMVGTIKVTM